MHQTPYTHNPSDDMFITHTYDYGTVRRPAWLVAQGFAT
jgi:hypothetical protein